MVRKVIGMVAACAFYLVPSAQDLHFSQFINSPLVTNPANTGFIPEGDYRLGINYRNQWSSIMSLPYKTMSAFGDVQTMSNEYNTGLQIQVIDIITIQVYTGRQVAIEEMTIKLIRKFKIGNVDLFIGPANIKTQAHKTTSVDHLVIGNGPVYFC